MKSWVSSLWVTLIFLAGMMSADGQVVTQGKTCGVLVTELECSTYLGQLDLSRTAEERKRIEKAHVELLKERARLCPSQSALRGSMKAEPLPSQRGFQRDPDSAPKIWM